MRGPVVGPDKGPVPAPLTQCHSGVFHGEWTGTAPLASTGVQLVAFGP